MENIIEEGEIKGAIDPITIIQTKIILKQMENSVCRISGIKFGTGFFCKIDLNNEKIPVLITNYRIINNDYIDSEKTIKIQIGEEHIFRLIKLNKSRIIYSSSNEIYDIMILKLYENDDIKNINYLEIDDCLLNHNSELAYEDSSIYLLHYPFGKEIKVSYGYGLEKKDKNNFIHKCKTSNGSSGSPIFNLSTNKVIGIHKSYIKSVNKDYKDFSNLGTFLKYPLLEMKEKNSNNININKSKQKYFEQEKENNDDILYDEIFFDKNQNYYDMILNFESFEQLKKQGWTANFSLEGWKKYQTSINSENIIIGVVGIKNRGKSYLLKRIMNNDNYQINDEFLPTDYGLNCKFCKFFGDKLNFVALGKSGLDNPLILNKFSKNDDINSIINAQNACEKLLIDFIINVCNVSIAVVEQLSFDEEEMLISLMDRLSLKEFDVRRLIVIHSLMNIERVEDINIFINYTLLKSLSFSLEPHYIKDYRDAKYNFTVYDQIMKDNRNLDIVHLIIGNDKIEEIRMKYNEPAFKYIRDYISIDSVRKFDILESFKCFVKNNYKKYINTNLFDDNPLEIGEKRIVKVYTDEEKLNTDYKIIKPIRLKNKNKIQNIAFKNIIFEPYGIVPLYSTKIINKNHNLFLEIIFEIYGKLCQFSTDILNDYDNNKIIINIRGKNEEFELDFLKNEGKKGIEIGNLKYKEFGFQVVLDRYETIKNNIIEIENNNIKPKLDEDTGTCTLLFPVRAYEI